LSVIFFSDEGLSLQLKSGVWALMLAVLDNVVQWWFCGLFIRHLSKKLKLYG